MYGNERVVVYLFLPKAAAPPYQTVVLFPGSNAVQAPTLNVPPFLYAFLLETGRAVVIPAYKGIFDRLDSLSLAISKHDDLLSRPCCRVGQGYRPVD